MLISFNGNIISSKLFVFTAFVFIIIIINIIFKGFLKTQFKLSLYLINKLFDMLVKIISILK